MIARFLTLFVAFTILPVGITFAEPKSVDKVPPESFQGVWQITKVTWKKRHEHEPDADKITEEKVVKGRVDGIFFRRHKSGSLQQFEPSKKSDEVSWSRGITILELTDDTLKYRWWSDHKAQYRQLTTNKDGSAVLKIYWPKNIETRYLKKKKGEQDGAEQPATAPDSKSEGSEKPKPESEGRSR